MIISQCGVQLKFESPESIVAFCVPPKATIRNLGVLKEHFSTRATSHTRLRACDHIYTSSTLIGGIGGAGPSSPLHTTLEGPRGMGMQDGCKVYMES
jgi:hypothetical protein